MKTLVITKNIAHTGILLLSTAQVLFAQAVLAEDSVTLTGGKLQIGISTTANRVEKPLEETLAAVSVITRQDIESIQAQNIVDVLRLQTGIDISRTGGAGATTSVFIRGVEADQVLVLIDGVRVASNTTGQFDWSQMPVGQVERIEIVRAPRAALYGSDAIGGIIQIFTRKNQQPYASLSVGKYDTQRLNGGFSAGKGKTRLSLNAVIEESDGFSAQNSMGSSYNPDNDPYSKRGASLSLSHQFGTFSKAGLDAFYNRNKADFDQGDTDSKLHTMRGYLHADVSPTWLQKLDISYARDDVFSNFSSAFGSGNSSFVTHRKALDWQNNFKLAKNSLLVIGANYREDSAQSADYDETISDKALYTQLNQKFGRFNLDVSGRYDKHSVSGAKVTGQIAAGFKLTENTTVYSNYGSAFKAPSINELFYPGFFGSFAGNPDLKPETSRSFEVGVKSRLTTNQYFETSLYHNKVDNLITYSGENNQAINSDKATFKGLELSYTGTRKWLEWGVNITLQSSEDDETGERLLRRPNTKATAKLGYKMDGNTRLGLDLSLVSARDDKNFAVFPAETVKLDNYQLLNMTLDHRLSKHAYIGFRIENVTDEKYQQAFGYNTPGRGTYLTFSYK